MSPLPSRYYKIILPVLVFGAAAILCVSVGYRTLHESKATTYAIPNATSSVANFSSSTNQTSHAPQQTTARATTSQPSLKSPPPIPGNYTQATLLISGTNYPLAAPPNSTVEAAMKILESQSSSFTFTEKTFPDLGEFVDSINSKENAGGYYWFLYVNGKDSSTGVSQTILHSGDVIEWQYKHQ